MYLYFIQFACFRQIAKIMSIMPLIMKPMLSGVEMTSITNGKSSGAGSLLMTNAIRPATNPTRRVMRPVRNVLSINIKILLLRYNVLGRYDIFLSSVDPDGGKPLENELAASFSSPVVMPMSASQMRTRACPCLPCCRAGIVFTCSSFVIQIIPLGYWWLILGASLFRLPLRI